MIQRLNILVNRENLGNTTIGGVNVDKQLREYRTGQGVPITGTYICQSGAKANFTKDDTFPQCPTSRKDTYWKRENENID